MEGLVLEDFRSGKTGSISSPRMLGAHPEANQAAMTVQFARQNVQLNRVLAANGWAALEAKGNEIVKRYKEHNDADKIKPKPGMTPEEMGRMSWQFEPVMVDPTEIANSRQQLVKLDQALRPLGFSVWTHPRTKRIANILNTSAEPGRPGYLRDSEQNLNKEMSPAMRWVGQPAYHAADAFISAAANVGVGIRSVLHDMGYVTLDGLTNGKASAFYNSPTSWVQSEDGTWFHNGGKVGAAEVYAGIWHSLTGEMIDQQLAELSDTAARARLQATGVHSLAIGLGEFAGSVAAFMGTGAPAMKVGTSLTKGLGIAITGGRAAASLARGEKIVALLAEKSGPAAALGFMEAVQSGRVEGYGKAFLHGTTMAVPLMLMGSVGQGLERQLTRFKHVPSRVAAGLAGAAEGIGMDFGTWDAAWQFIRDPNDHTFAAMQERILVNAIGNGVLRGAGGPSVARFGSPTAEQRATLDARAKAMQGQNPAAAATATGTTPGTVTKLQTAADVRRATAGSEPDVSARAQRDLEAADVQARKESAGLTMTDNERLDKWHAAREVVKGLLEFPDSPERTTEIVKTFEENRLAYGDRFEDEVVDAARQMKPEAANQLTQELLGRAHEEEPPERTFTQQVPGVEQVPGKEPGPIRPRASEPGGKPPASEMVQEGGRAGLEPERMADEGAEAEAQLVRGLERRISQTPDPLEDPRFLELDPEFQKQLREASLEERKSLFYSKIVERRIGGERRQGEETPERAMLDAPVPPGIPGQPKSIRMLPELQAGHVPGTPRTRLSDVMRMLEGFEGDPVHYPFRKGVGIRGRLSTRGILGWFHTREGVARLANLVGAVKIAAGAHEWSHGMDIETNATVGIWDRLTQQEREGFIRAAFPYYPGYAQMSLRGRAMESWAEFWGRFILDDPTLREETGHFWNWAMDWIAQPGRERLLQRLIEVQDTFRNYRDQGVLERKRAQTIYHGDRPSRQELLAAGVTEDTIAQHGLAKVRQIWRAIDKAFGFDLRELQRAQERALGRTMSPEEARAVLEELPITANAARLIQAKRMTASKEADRFLSVSTHDVSGATVTGESLRAIQADINALAGENASQEVLHENSKRFWDWLHAKQEMEMLTPAMRVNPETGVLEERRGALPTGMTMAENRLVALTYERPEFEGLARRIKSFADRVIDYTVEGGLRSEQQGRDIKSGYRYYFPIQRRIEGPEQFAPGRGVAERGTGMKERTGGAEENIDPLNAFANYVRTNIQKTHQAMAVKAMLKFGILTNRVGSFVTEVKRDVIPKQHIIRDVLRAITGTDPGTDPLTSAQLQMATETIDALSQQGAIGEAITLFEQQVIPKGSRAIISFRPHFRQEELDEMNAQQRRHANDVNGKLIWLELDLDAFNAVRGIDTPVTILDQLPEFVQAWAERATKLQRHGAVTTSPAFVIRNAIRDAFSSALYTEQPARFGVFSAFARMYAGAIDILNHDPSALQYEAIGGGASTYFSGEISRGRAARDLVGLYAGVWGNLRRSLHAWTDRLGQVEQLLRQQAFKFRLAQERAAGRSEIDAAISALEASKQETADLTKGGVLAHAYNRLTPFFRANIAGSRQFVRAMTGAEGPEVQRRSLTRLLVGVTIPSMVLWWFNHDEKWYQELPEWERLNFWHIKVPGVSEPLRIPKPFEIGKVGANMPEAALDMMFSENPIGMSRVMWDTVTSMIPQQWMPSIMQPFLEYKTNYDFFHGRQVVPGWMQNYRVTQDQYTVYTRWYAKMISNALGFAHIDISPIHIENTLDTVTGGAIGRGADFAEQMRTLAGSLTGEGFQPHNIPVFGTLFRRGEFGQSRSVQEIFNLDSHFNQLSGSKALTADDKRDRKIIGDAKDAISDLKKAARAGKMSQSAADGQSANIARQALKRTGRTPKPWNMKFQ